MSKVVKHIVIVGGGTAGWLTAGILASQHNANSEHGIKITLIESPDVKTIGVGEGTWPTMRNTLQSIGISETEFVRCCDASFKQGSQFLGWVTGKQDDSYYHPFVAPHGHGQTDLIANWQRVQHKTKFAHDVSFQPHLCDNGCAPKQYQTPEYAAVANYGYHLNAGKFSALLQKHCIEKLGVKHVVDHVISVNDSQEQHIKSVTTKHHKDISAELFIDCSGSAALLIGQHYEIPFICKKHVLFNDTALAAQVPYPESTSAIASHTLSTATGAGWIWDIGLPTRKGIGHVYASDYTNDTDAETELRNYLSKSLPQKAVDDINIRKITFNPGHRQKFWHKNCVAVGMAAGFLEPLEASALALVELSAHMISKELPAHQSIMEITASRFNKRFEYRWQRIIEFLKLHYVLSQRTDSDYWRNNRLQESVPERLAELLTLWRYQEPSFNDFTEIEEIFPSASYQYILYGMGFTTNLRATKRKFDNETIAKQLFAESHQLSKKYIQGLPANRALIDHIIKTGLPT